MKNAGEELIEESIKVSSLTHGSGTSVTEVTQISPHGIWLLTSTGKEIFMSFESFPWFKDQPVRVIFNVEEQSQGHFYWPDIDVDLSLDTIENPTNFPLKASQKNLVNALIQQCTDRS